MAYMPALLPPCGDITSQREIEIALKASEEKYRALFENSIDAVMLGAPDGSVYAANSEACRLFGMTESELIQGGRQGISDLTDPTWQTALVERTRTGRYKGELLFKRADGSNFMGEISSAFFTNLKGEINSSIIIRDISERKKMEKAIKVSEQRFRTLIERAPAPVGISRQGITTYVNERYLQLFGIKEVSEVYGHSLLEQIAPQCRDEIAERARRRELGAPVVDEYETVGLSRDGSQIPLWAAVSRIESPEGPASMAFFTDITELKRVQAGLQESEEKYRGLFEQMVSGFALHEIILDENGIPVDYVTLEVNREYELLLQTSRDTVIGKRAYQAIPGLDKFWIELFGSIVLTGQPRRYTQYASNLDKWFEGQAFKIGDKKFAVTFVDITDRKKAEQELKNNEIKFRTVSDFTYNWEYWRGADGNLKYVSPSCERVTGYSREEFMQNPHLLLNIIHPADKPQTEKHLREQHSDISALDFRIITRSGETRWIGHNCQPIFDPEGRWLGQRASNRDITQRIQMEQDLARSQEQLGEFTMHLQEAIEIEKNQPFA